MVHHIKNVVSVCMSIIFFPSGFASVFGVQKRTGLVSYLSVYISVTPASGCCVVSHNRINAIMSMSPLVTAS